MNDFLLLLGLLFLAWVVESVQSSLKNVTQEIADLREQLGPVRADADSCLRLARYIDDPDTTDDP